MWAFPVPVAIVACFFMQKKISEVLATKFLIEPILSFKAEKFGALKDYITSADLENKNKSSESGCSSYSSCGGCGGCGGCGD